MTTLTTCLTYVRQLDDLVRLHQIGFVVIWPLLGLAAVSNWSWDRCLAIIGVSFFFNAFGVLVNDIVDLPVDRSSPHRDRYVLVRGRVTRWQALALALIQIPLALVVHWAAALPSAALVWLLAAMLCMMVYDLWSKACPLPIAMDSVLALSGMLLVLYGAGVSGERWNDVLWLTAGYGAVFLLFVNGFCNGLRDLGNDTRCGCRTTPTWLGCRPVAGRVVVSARMTAYSLALQAALVALAFLTLHRRSSPFDGGDGLAIVLVSTTVCVVGLVFLATYRARASAWGVVMRTHLLLLPLPLMLAFLPELGLRQCFALVVSYVVSSVVFAPVLAALRSERSPRSMRDVPYLAVEWLKSPRQRVKGNLRAAG